MRRRRTGWRCSHQTDGFTLWPATSCLARVASASRCVCSSMSKRKILVFSLTELPELARGQGVTLQRYRDGGLSDAVAFRLAEGLSWALGGESGRVRTEIDLTPWRAARGAAGRMPPIGFPRNNRFS